MSITLPQVTVVGTLTADPDMKFVGNGTAVANFTIASNSRKYDKDAEKYVDGDATFLRCTVWKEVAENVAESLMKGSRVIATGVLKQESWEKDGQKHTVLKLEVDEIGPSLRWSTAKVSKAGTRAKTGSDSGWGDTSPGW